MNDVTSVRQMVGRVAREVGWAPVTVLVLHSVSGRIFGHEPYVDPAMHFSGGVVAAYFFRNAGSIGSRFLGTPTHLALDLLAFGLTCAVALLWELGELVSDEYLGTNVLRDVHNTVRDLFLGMLGGILYIAAARVYRSFPRRL